MVQGQQHDTLHREIHRENRWAARPDFPAFPFPPVRGKGERERSPEIPGKDQGKGKREIGNREGEAGMELKTLGEVKMATKRELIADHLRVAAQIIESRGHEESAAWRMADAAVMLIDLLDSMGQTDVQGVHYASGMGGQMRKTKAFAR